VDLLTLFPRGAAGQPREGPQIGIKWLGEHLRAIRTEPGSSKLVDIKITEPQNTELLLLCWSRRRGLLGTFDDSTEFHDGPLTWLIGPANDSLPLKAPLSGAVGRNSVIDQSMNVVPRFYYLVTVSPANAEVERKRYALGHQAAALEQQGQLKQALRVYQEAVDIGSQSGIAPEASTLNHLGLLHARTGNLGAALECFRVALKTAEGERDTRGEAVIRNNMGDTWRTFGYTEKSLDLFRGALDLDVASSDNMLRGVTHNNIGLVLMQRADGKPRDLESAERHFQAALEAYRSEEGRLFRLPSQMELSRGRGMSTADDAFVRHFAATVAVSGDDPRQGAMVTHNNIGRLCLRQGRIEQAREHLGIALELQESTHGDLRPRAATLINLGHVEEASARVDRARTRYEEALEVARQTADAGVIATAHQALARFFHGRGDVVAALQQYRAAATFRAQERGSVLADADRVTFSDQDVGLFAGWALAWLAASPGRDNQSAALSALAAAERGRAQALLDLMQSSGPTGPKSQLGAGPSQDMGIEGSGLVHQALNGASAGLYYLVTPEKLVVWLLLPGRVCVAQVGVRPSMIEDLVGRLRSGLGASGAARALGDLEERQVVAERVADAAEELSAARERLTKLLLPKELRSELPDTGELLIVPDGVLNLVPFSILGPDSRGRSLGERFALRYAPSLTALVEAARKPQIAPETGEGARALVVGNPTMPVVGVANGDKRPLPPLPGAALEGDWVAERLGAAVLTARSATETEVKKRLPGASFVHLATHGFAYANPARAPESFVALAPDGKNDGLLTVAEVLEEMPSISAELVVLSACQTGLGSLHQAEGTVGLQRAFLAKGARSVIVSLWSVSDRATALLMRNFYSHWLADKDRPSKAEALGRASRDVSRAPGFEHPKFWAAFQLVGA
jgi:CHAT domain-containing protein/tetratricopeptide (TPR) repeat protein